MPRQEIIDALVRELQRIHQQDPNQFSPLDELAPFEICGEDEVEKLENLAIAIETFERNNLRHLS